MVFNIPSLGSFWILLFDTVLTKHNSWELQCIPLVYPRCWGEREKAGALGHCITSSQISLCTYRLFSLQFPLPTSQTTASHSPTYVETSHPIHHLLPFPAQLLRPSHTNIPMRARVHECVLCLNELLIVPSPFIIRYHFLTRLYVYAYFFCLQFPVLPFLLVKLLPRPSGSGSNDIFPVKSF